MSWCHAVGATLTWLAICVFKTLCQKIISSWRKIVNIDLRTKGGWANLRFRFCLFYTTYTICQFPWHGIWNRFFYLTFLFFLQQTKIKTIEWSIIFGSKCSASQFVHIRINCYKKAIEYVWILTAIVPRNPTLVVKKLLALLYGIRGWTDRHKTILSCNDFQSFTSSFCYLLKDIFCTLTF